MAADLQTFRDYLAAWSEAASRPNYDAEEFAALMAQLGDGRPRQMTIVPQRFGIEYQDEEHAPSSRTISVKRVAISSEGAGLLQGYCFWRKEPRTFRLDRLISVIDADGEYHNPPTNFIIEMFETFAVHVRHDEVALRRFSQRFSAHFAILKLMANADGEIHPKEEEAIIDYAARLMVRSDFYIGNEELHQFNRWLKRLEPEPQDYFEALDDLEARPERELLPLFQSAKEVLLADGLQHPEECRLLDDLCVRLGGAALQ